MNRYVTTLPFDEVGLTNEGVEVGMFSGDAHLDADGNVVGLTLDTWSSNKRAKPFYIDVPPHNASGGLTFWQEIASRLADWLENSCNVEIQQEIIDYRASLSHREFEYEEAV